MDSKLIAEVEFGDGQWILARARHIEKNAYLVILPPFTSLPAGFYRSPPLVGILIEGVSATYVHSSTMRVTKEGETLLLAITDPNGPQPV